MAKKWYNNGIEEKLFVIGQQPEGWAEGLTKETKLKRREKCEQTCMLKYGVKNVFQLDSVKEKCNTDEVIEKANLSRLKTFNEKYSVDNPSQLDEVKEKKKQTCLTNHGVECGFQTKTCIIASNNPELIKQKQESTRVTLLERYNVINSFLIHEIYEKAHSIEAKQKAKITNNLKSEAEKLEIVLKSIKHESKYLYNNIKFDSSWELAFWIYCNDNSIPIEREPIQLEYYFQNKKYYYIPDFRLNNSELIELKSDYLFKLLQIPSTKDFAKYQCMVSNNVKILILKDVLFYLKYIYNKYGNKYLKQFKIKKEG